MSRQTETEITRAIMTFKSIPYTLQMSPERPSVFTNNVNYVSVNIL